MKGFRLATDGFTATHGRTGREPHADTRWMESDRTAKGWAMAGSQHVTRRRIARALTG